jgi:hypothetical protein
MCYDISFVKLLFSFKIMKFEGFNYNIVNLLIY